MEKPQYLSRKFLELLFTFTLVVFGAGCAGRAPAPNTTLPPSSGPGGESAIITFAAAEYQQQLFEALMETFHEQNPDISVQFVDINQFYPSGDEGWNQFTYFRNIAQAADTVLLQSPFFMDMSRYFRDLQPLYETDTSFQPDDFWPGILTSCEDTNGNVVGLPLTASLSGIFYDEAAFDAAGLPYPQPGWTWDDFQNAVVALSDKSGRQVKYGFYDMPDLGTSILAPTIGDHFRTHGGEVDPTDLLNEVKWYIELARTEKLSGVKDGEDLINAWNDRWQLFEDVARRPGMWIDSLISSVPTTEMYNSSSPFYGMAIDRYGFAPYPVSADASATQASQNQVECAAVSAGSTNPRAAWRWLRFLSQHWIVMDQTSATEISRAPARQSVAESNGYWDLIPAKAVPTIRYILEHGSYDFSYFDQFGEINIALAKSISENADFVQILQDALAIRPAILPTPQIDNSPIVVATPRAPLPEGVVAVKYYISSYTSNELNTLNTLVEQFNQRSPSARVSLVTDFQGDPGGDWIGYLASNFDCFTTNTPYWENFNATSVLNLNSLLSNEPASFTTDFVPEMMNKFSREGILYALPASSQVQMIAYNADLLARRGLPLPANDWTFDDFVELASAVASTSDSDPSYGFLYSPYNEDEFLALGRGVRWIDFKPNPPQVDLTGPDMLEYLNWISKAQQERLIFNQENNWEKMDSIISSGQLAFWIATMGEQSIWFTGSGKESPYKIGMAPIPQVSGNNPMVSWSNDRGHFISADSPDPRACWDWIKFLSEQSSLFAGVPARRSIVESPAWEASIGKENAKAYRVALANLKPIESMDVSLDTMKILWPLNTWKTQAVQAALEGQDIQPFVTAQQQKVETYLPCVSTLDMSKPVDQLSEEILSCLKQADPEGNW